jgi:PAS domain S-box-containing protein
MDSRFIEVNDTFEHMTGWRRDEVIGRTPYDIGVWVEPNQRSDIVQRLVSGETIRNVEVAIRTKNGEVQTNLGSAKLITINGELCMFAVAARHHRSEASAKDPTAACGHPRSGMGQSLRCSLE